MKESRTKPQVDIELRPDGWQRFEAAVDVAVGNHKRQPTKTPKAEKRSASRKVRKAGGAA